MNLVPLAPSQYGSADGLVTIVPEPVNVALAVFGGLFAGTMAVRWIFRKRPAQPTR